MPKLIASPTVIACVGNITKLLKLIGSGAILMHPE